MNVCGVFVETQRPFNFTVSSTAKKVCMFYTELQSVITSHSVVYLLLKCWQETSDSSYFIWTEDIYESVDNQNITDFIKDAHLYHQLL